MQSHKSAGARRTEGETVASSVASFGEQFRCLRKHLIGKQICLSRAGLRCTDAAISYWETGRRLPSRRMLRNVIAVLRELGATAREMEDLHSAWFSEWARKRGRNAFALEAAGDVTVDEATVLSDTGPLPRVRRIRALTE